MQDEYMFEIRCTCSAQASAHRKEQHKEYERLEREGKDNETI